MSSASVSSVASITPLERRKSELQSAGVPYRTRTLRELEKSQVEEAVYISTVNQFLKPMSLRQARKWIRGRIICIVFTFLFLIAIVVLVALIYVTVLNIQEQNQITFF
jgi:nitrate/nitrite-specific signal transduction histidine kinase